MVITGTSGGETYRLSVFLRSDNANTKAVVRIFGDKGDVQFLKMLGPLGTQWKKYEMSFKSNANATDAVLQIGVKGQQTVWAHRETFDNVRTSSEDLYVVQYESVFEQF